LCTGPVELSSVARAPGKIRLIDDRKQFIDKKNELVPDAYGIGKTGFQKALGKGGSIKYRPMNQM
jgi:hypothetical protein